MYSHCSYSLHCFTSLSCQQNHLVQPPCPRVNNIVTCKPSVLNVFNITDLFPLVRHYIITNETYNFPSFNFTISQSQISEFLEVKLWAKSSGFPAVVKSRKVSELPRKNGVLLQNIPPLNREVARPSSPLPDTFAGTFPPITSLFPSL